MPRKRKTAKRHTIRRDTWDTPLFRHHMIEITAETEFSLLSKAEQSDVIRKWRAGKMSDEEFNSLFLFDVNIADHDEIWDAQRWLDEYQRGARQHLESHGYEFEDWRELPFTRQKDADLTVWKARNILIDVETATKAVAAGQTDLACSLAFRIAGDFMMMVFTPAEDFVGRGQRALQRSRNMGRSRRIPKAKVKKLREVASEIWATDETLSALKIGKLLAKPFGMSHHTVRRKVADLKPSSR